MILVFDTGFLVAYWQIHKGNLSPHVIAGFLILILMEFLLVKSEKWKTFFCFIGKSGHVTNRESQFSANVSNFSPHFGRNFSQYSHNKHFVGLSINSESNFFVTAGEKSADKWLQMSSCLSQNVSKDICSANLPEQFWSFAPFWTVLGLVLYDLEMPRHVTRFSQLEWLQCQGHLSSILNVILYNTCSNYSWFHNKHFSLICPKLIIVVVYTTNTT